MSVKIEPSAQDKIFQRFSEPEEIKAKQKAFRHNGMTGNPSLSEKYKVILHKTSNIDTKIEPVVMD